MNDESNLLCPNLERVLCPKKVVSLSHSPTSRSPTSTCMCAGIFPKVGKVAVILIAGKNLNIEIVCSEHQYDELKLTVK